MSVINEAYLASFMDIDQSNVSDELLTDTIAAAQTSCEQWCRVDGFENDSTVDEYHDIEDRSTSFIFVRVLPLNSVTTLTDDAQDDSPDTISSGDFIIDSNSGRVQLDGDESYFTRGVQSVRVQYDGGYTAALMPSALKLAVAHEAARLWNNRDRAGVANESADGVSIEWETGDVCSAAAGLLRPYRRMVF